MIQERKFIRLDRAMILIIPLLLLSACNNTRFLKPGEVLYTGAKIKMIPAEDFKPSRSLKGELKSKLHPEPNKKTLGFRTKLWYYNIAGEVKKKKGFKYWLKNVVGEKPVLLTDVSTSEQEKQLVTILENKGYFNSTAVATVKEKKKKAKVIYNLTIPQPYKIGEIIFPNSNWEIHKAIFAGSKKTLLKEGDPYDLDIIKKERERINSDLKSLGYFYFSPDYLLFKADTSEKDKKVNLTLTVKLEIPHEATHTYKLNNIYISPNHSLDLDYIVKPGDTTLFNGYYFIGDVGLFRLRTLQNAVALKPGDFYKRENHELTLNRLTNLGVFKFVNMHFIIPANCDEENLLDCHIFLTPTLKRSVRIELQGVSKSNDFSGPAVSAGFRNRNLRRGAELFIFNVNASYESQFKSRSRSLSTTELGVEAKLFIPRILVPFHIARNSKAQFPKTQILTGMSQVSRINIFDMQTYKIVYGYTWKENKYKSHELNPVSINYLNLSNTSARFKDLLDKNLLLRKSFEEQFLIGGNYNFVYNTLVDESEHNNYFFRGSVDLSGNVASLIEKVIVRKQTISDFFGDSYSQFARFDTDFRIYKKTGEHSKLVTRLMAGIGIPYGNSTVLPYIRQFFSGGTNSVRAFPARSIGPGRYTPGINSTGIFNQPGDIRLEGNIEYRFDITSTIKGALFTDAGNVWLVKKNPEFPGGEFDPGRFLTEFAIGSGVGLRYDVSYFVLRFDLAVPVKKPFRENGRISAPETINSWFVNKNYILNVAIGYPF